MAYAADAASLPGTQPLTIQGDLSAQMVAGIDKFLMTKTEASRSCRTKHWKRDSTSPRKYEKSVAPNRQRFLKYIGVVDPREPIEIQLVGTTSQPALVGEAEGYHVFAVRWNVLDCVDGEGLLLQPKKKPVANVVALPDCDRTPEMLVGLMPGVPRKAQFARRLAENGCRVLVPVLIDRGDTYSGTPRFRMTNQPHREFIYRAAFEMGRHIIGYEVQKVLGAVDWLASDNERARNQIPIGVFGYGEGGLVGFYAAAADTRIDVAGVSGYFQPREHVWTEPVYRDVWGLIDEFGDAEIASLIAPRALVVEACRMPEVTGPPPVTPTRSGATPNGAITTPALSLVEAEFQRAQQCVAGLKPPPSFTLTMSGGGIGRPGTDETLGVFLRELGVSRATLGSHKQPKHLRKGFDPKPRLKRQFEQMVGHTQTLMYDADFRREEFWSKADNSSVEKWEESCRWYREYFWDEVIGRFPPATERPNARSRLVYDEPTYRGYEVVLDVYPDVFAYGILLLPKDIQQGERRPVVVCQHGLEGRPQDVADAKIDSLYHHFACKLAERGFVAFAPQNPYIGEDLFRILQRKAHPLKKSLFSVIVRQHERILQWLSEQPFIDPERIAFYGISYGGKTAMRVPALLEQYCLSICSADYNEWIWKNVSARHGYSYLLSREYDMIEFDLGNTFNYAEMSWLILPRPFMVEWGHHSTGATSSYEYAKTRRRYDLLGLGERSEMEIFIGGHEINGVGTFEFLHRHLKWPQIRE